MFTTSQMIGSPLNTWATWGWVTDTQSPVNGLVRSVTEILVGGAERSTILGWQPALPIATRAATTANKGSFLQLMSTFLSR
jgi:hypothetical protein